MEGHDDPDDELDHADPHNVEAYSNGDASLDFVDVLQGCLVIFLPLVVDKASEHPHEISGSSDVGLVVELVHELRLRLHLGVCHRISPVIYNDQDESSDYRS